MPDADAELRRLAFNPTDAERLAGAEQTRESLDHTLRAYAKIERSNAALRRELKEYRQAALELNAEIREALAWIGSGCEPSVAHSMMLKTAEKWRPLLEGSEGHLGG